MCRILTCCEPGPPYSEVKGLERGSPYDVKMEVKSEVEIGTDGAGRGTDSFDSAAEEKS